MKDPTNWQVEFIIQAGMVAFVDKDLIDMACSKKLFGVFQRMHKQSDFQGTGFELATAQQIIHRHWYHIWAESEMNQGTTFYFTIPEDSI